MASYKDSKKFPPLDADKKEKLEPYSNLIQERLILAQLKRTNPEAYKLLKNYAYKK